MKKLYFLAFGLILSSFQMNAQTELINDDMESYTLGNIGNQNPTVWSVWSGNPNPQEDMNIVNTQANSGSQSGRIDNSGVTDVMLLLGNQTTGLYTLDFQMYIPAGRTGYFNVQGMTEGGGAGNAGAGVFNSGDIIFNANAATPGVVTETAGAVAIFTLTYPQDAWFPVSIAFDLTVTPATYQVTIDGNSGPVSDFRDDNVLGGIDFFSIDTNNEYYIDDVVFTQESLGVDSFNRNSFSFYPNPVQNKLNFNAVSPVQNVTVFDIVGKQVLQVQPNATVSSIDMSGLSSGTYLVEVTIDGSSKVFKVLK